MKVWTLVRVSNRRKGMDGLVLVLGKITHLRLFAVGKTGTHRQPSDVQSEPLKV